MKTFELTLSTEPKFRIHDYSKLESVVCHNKTGWCDVFNKYESVEDFIDSHARMAFFTHRSFEKKDGDDNYHYYMFIEGIGCFRQERESRWWKLHDK